MSPVVIDTNVLAVAEGLHGAASLACVGACATALARATKQHRVVLDSSDHILSEYRGAIDTHRQKGTGAVFLKWLYQNMWTQERCDRIDLTQSGDSTQFAEFPAHQELREEVDRSDRKFIAVAHAHPEKPQIWEAVDSKWLNWETNLKAFGISVAFLCPADIKRFHASKAKKK